TPKPIRARAKTANDCSLIINSRKIIVKAKNPGISLTLCKIPISTPVKLALSNAKLFIRTLQLLNAIGVAIDIKINIKIGVILKFKDFILRTLYESH
ncbi:MAG TPA: hypothetical protein QGH67_00720, partial [Alphaproteobacteria bacterium]|nr:hypothetical protein [Alphaproteobacteria bacterium]